MKISTGVKRTCKFNGSSYDVVELTDEDIKQALIEKCKIIYGDNEGCEFSIDEINLTY